jgi:hypothetical protein
MKWIFGLLCTALLFTSCDNELIVTDEWKDIPVVWGLLSKSDTAHYIRVEKAYLDPTTSALDIARIPDSLYYEDAVVTLRRIASGEVFTLTRVDGNLEGYPRDTGVFAEFPNYIYKISADDLNLVIRDEYEFKLQRNDHTVPVTARTIILPKPVLRAPVVGSILNFKSGSNFTFMWNELEEAGLFDIIITFHYSQRAAAPGSLYEPQTFKWVVQRNLQKREHKIDGSEFYSAVKANIEEELGVSRIFDSLDIQIWCGGHELEEFVKITQANTGITSTQDIPSYTNLSEGLGIFTSRNVALHTGFQLGPETLDSLSEGTITKALNFN